MKYLQRRANRFEFRFSLPDDIAGKAAPVPWPDELGWCVNAKTGRFKQELVRSLATSDSRTAERAALPLIEEAHRLVDTCRKALQEGPPTALPPGMIERLARRREAEVLEADEAVRLRGIGLDVHTASIDPSRGFTDDDYELYRQAVDHLDDVTRKEAARLRGGEALQLSLNRAVEESGIVLHPDDPAWRQLEVAFIKSQRQAIDSIKARLRGDIVATPAAPAATKDTAGSLSDALRRWQQGGGRSARRPSTDSAGEAERAVRRFIELHGDLPLTEITKAHARSYRDALAKVPKGLPHRLARLPLPKLLQQNLSRYSVRNAQTINKALSLLSGIFTKAEKDGYFEHLPAWNNPFRVGFEIDHQDREHYQPFSIDELNALFFSPVFTRCKRPVAGRGEAAYWFPLISLFAGARRTEIAQLRVCDVRLSDNIWFLDFTDEGEDQRLKNLSSARSVPVHQTLIEIGLIDYITTRRERAGDAAMLWPGFDQVQVGVRAWSKWFGRYLTSCGIDDPTKTFHSFRHTFKRACREAGITEEIHHAFTGHAGGGVGRSYGRQRRSDGSMDRGVSLAKLKQEIDRVTYDGLKLPRPRQPRGS